jgi:TPR repeat protein
MRYLAITAALALTLLAAPAPATDTDRVLDGKAAAELGDYVRAVAIWQPLAEAGDPRAETYMGIMYDNGYGVPQNRAEAFRLFERAANRGYASAQYNLAFMYHHGRAVQRSQTEALKWYRQAAAQGDVAAQYNLGKMYAHGLVVQRDLVTAHMWLELASRARTSVRPLAARDRRDLEKQMNAAEIEEAGQRAQRWRPS